MSKFNGVSLIQDPKWPEPDTIMATDSSLKACGGWCNNGVYFHAVFPEFIQKLELPINALELLTILVALKLWGHMYKNMKVHVYCDNLTSVQVLGTGKCYSPYRWCNDETFYLRFNFIPYTLSCWLYIY